MKLFDELLGTIGRGDRVVVVRIGVAKVVVVIVSIGGKIVVVVETLSIMLDGVVVVVASKATG